MSNPSWGLTPGHGPPEWEQQGRKPHSHYGDLNDDFRRAWGTLFDQFSQPLFLDTALETTSQFHKLPENPGRPWGSRHGGHGHVCFQDTISKSQVQCWSGLSILGQASYPNPWVTRVCPCCSFIPTSRRGVTRLEPGHRSSLGPALAFCSDKSS